MNVTTDSRAEPESVTVHLHPGQANTVKMTSLNGEIALGTVMVRILIALCSMEIKPQAVYELYPPGQRTRSVNYVCIFVYPSIAVANFNRLFRPILTKRKRHVAVQSKVGVFLKTPLVGWHATKE